MSGATAWAAEEDALATRLWREGSSASQIARELYTQTKVYRSRNAVIGRLHRMGVASKTTTKQRVTRAQAIRNRRGQPRPRIFIPKPEPVRPAPIILSPSLNIPFLERKSNQCAAITGNERYNQTCCGNPVAAHSVYCVEHTQLHYQPNDKAKKKRDASTRLATWLDFRDRTKAHTAGFTG